MSMIEWIAAGLGVMCVGLGAMRSMWTFPTAIGSVTLLGIVVWQERLYSDALLQMFFVGANLYGWVDWTRSRQRSGTVMVERLSWTGRVAWLSGIAGSGMALGLAMARFTSAALPWWDAGVTAASMAAQVLMAQRRWENWVLWVLVDVAAIALYHVKALEPFAMLYVVYLLLSVWGLIQWVTVRGSVRRRPISA